MTWLRIDEAAIAAGVSERTVIRWINTGLRAKREHGHWLVELDALDQWRANWATRQGLRRGLPRT